jgi:hypothetical protein
MVRDSCLGNQRIENFTAKAPRKKERDARRGERRETIQNSKKRFYLFFSGALFLLLASWR